MLTHYYTPVHTIAACIVFMFCHHMCLLKNFYLYLFTHEQFIRTKLVYFRYITLLEKLETGQAFVIFDYCSAIPAEDFSSTDFSSNILTNYTMPLRNGECLLITS